MTSVMTKTSWSISNGMVFVVLVVVIMKLDPTNSSSVSLLISHWSNIHGHYGQSQGNGGLGGLVTRLTQTSSHHQQNHIRLSSGDFLGPENGWLSLFASSKYETLFFALLKELHNVHLAPTAVSATWDDLRFGIDLASQVLGGFTYSLHGLANPPNLLLSNVFHPMPTQLQIWAPWKIHQAKDNAGKTFLIGILGFLPPVPFIEGVIVQDVVSSLHIAMDRASRSSNSPIHLFIAVGDGDPKLCRTIMDTLPQIKVIISGKSFRSTDGGHLMHENGGIVASAGIKGSTLGEIELTINSSTGQFISSNVSLLTNTFLPGENVQKTLTNLANLIHHNSSAYKFLGQVEYPLEGSCRTDSLISHLLGNIVTDSLSRCIDRGQLFSKNGGDLRNHKHKPIIALWHSDGLTSGILDIPAFQDIRELDVHQWMPFLHSAKLFRLYGHQLGTLFTKYYTRLHVSEQLRVVFHGMTLEGIYYSEGTRVSDDEELLVLLPSFLIQDSLKLLSLDASSSIIDTHSPVTVHCIITLFQETRHLTWGATMRVKVLKSDLYEWLWFLSGLALGFASALLLVVSGLRLLAKTRTRFRHWNLWRWTRLTYPPTEEEDDEGVCSWPLIERRESTRPRGRYRGDPHPLHWNNLSC